MKKILGIMAASALLTTMAGLPAAAQQDEAEQLFAQLDANKDGKLSEAEFTAHPDLTKDVFAQWDADGDKYVSKAEFTANFGGSK